MFCTHFTVTFANGAIRKESRKRKLRLSAFKDAKHRRGGEKKKKLLVSALKDARHSRGSDRREKCW